MVLSTCIWLGSKNQPTVSGSIRSLPLSWKSRVNGKPLCCQYLIAIQFPLRIVRLIRTPPPCLVGELVLFRFGNRVCEVDIGRFQRGPHRRSGLGRP